MRLYFVRHGIAEDVSANVPEAERKLTETGVANTRRAADLLKALGVEPDRLYSSPLVRARQTANIIGRALDVDVQVRREVGPGFSLQAVETLTEDLSENDEVLFVGHEPDFSATIGALVGGRIVMKKGSLARVDLVSAHPLVGELTWLIAPRIFEQFKANK